jgi:hypothetical protein
MCMVYFSLLDLSNMVLEHVHLSNDLFGLLVFWPKIQWLEYGHCIVVTILA